MIHFFGTRQNLHTFGRLTAAGPRLPVTLSVHAYQEVFSREQFPSGTLVFTDFDLLHAFEIDVVSAMIQAARGVDPEVVVLNDPAEVLERTPLLHRLHVDGGSPIAVTRLELGDRPTQYPVFIRSEDGCAGPETEPLHSEAELESRLEAMRRAGLTLKRRIAVTYVAERDADGLFRKYGAFVIGDEIIPQHILRSQHWNVKSRSSETDAAFVAEEARYVEENPHALALLELAQVAGTRFGRIDYMLQNDRPIAYEINTNPTFPRFEGGAPLRGARRAVILSRLGDALAKIDSPGDGVPIRFGRPQNGNSPFVAYDPWYRQPMATLQRPRAWARLRSQLRGANR